MSVLLRIAGPAHEAVDTELAAALAQGNSTTKEALLSRAKDAIAAGDQSLQDAAEALALAQEEFKASQRDMASAVGKSVAWVNRLLHWRREGCVGSPFGPGSKARRERQKNVQAPEQRAPGNVNADDAEVNGQNCKAENPKREATSNRLAQGALVEFKVAVKTWFAKMDDDAIREAVEYVIVRSKVKGSRASDRADRAGVTTGDAA